VQRVVESLVNIAGMLREDAERHMKDGTAVSASFNDAMADQIVANIALLEGEGK
jgi:hypothetical protein